MTFGQPWMLWSLALPLLWALWEWKRTQRRLGLLLKALVFGLILLAVAEPRWVALERGVAAAVLADVSGSVPADQIEQLGRTVEGIESARGRNLMRTILFDERVRPDIALGADRNEPAGTLRGTNIEAALRGAMATLPSGRVPRVVLISDGRENHGAVERAVYQARQRGIPLDAIALEGRERPALRMVSASFPARVFAGERFPIQAVVESPRAANAEVLLTAEGTTIGRERVRLNEGQTLVSVWARIETTDAVLIEGTVSADALGEVRFPGTMTFQRPRALLLSGDASDSDSVHLLRVLVAAGFEVEQAGGMALPSEIDGFDIVIANNVDLESWPLSSKTAAAEFVREGGGWLVIGGENNLYAEAKEEDPDPLTRMLPAEPAPPEAPEGTAVVLVVDKSSSMEGRKMQLARQSAIGVVENLRPIDRVGVLVFDNSFEWAVPLQRNEQPGATTRLISGIAADGGTQIAPALKEAFRNIARSNAVYKHIVLLTDGISEEGDSITLARDATEAKVTISTIGLGQDVNRGYLERVARVAQGRSYFLIDVSGLAQLVLRDVMEHTGSSVREEEAAPVVVQQTELLEGIPLDEAAPLQGWVKFIAKPEAETLLEIGDQDPLLVRWQYGLGRATVFTSDAKERWAAGWVGWPGFDRLWTNVLRDLLPRTASTEAGSRLDSSNGDLLVEYRLAGPRQERLTTPPELYVLGPDGFREHARLERAGARGYQARIPLGDRFGLFRVRAASDLELFPEIAFYRPNQELEDYGADLDVLRWMAEYTGGRFNPTPAQVFDPAGRSVETVVNLWPMLLVLAILLNLIELLARKGWLPWLGRWA